MTFILPKLPYDQGALAPHMSKETLEYHHGKHHDAYVKKANELIKGTEWEGKPIEEVMKGTFGKNQPLFNNVAQHYNHSEFWLCLSPKGGGKKMPGSLEKKITTDFGSFDAMGEQLVKAGMDQFGSGWCWLSLKNGKLEVSKTPNGENPIVHGAVPLLTCDVWEHSYYIDHHNKRPDYLKTFMEHLVNWDHVAERYEAATR